MTRYPYYLFSEAYFFPLSSFFHVFCGEGDDRGWDGWMVSPTQWTWVWASSGRWWGTGRPGMLQSMGSQSQTWLGDWTTTVWLLLTPKTLTDTLSDWLFSGHTGLLSVPWKYWFLIHGLVTSLVVFFLLWRYTVVKKKRKRNIHIYMTNPSSKTSILEPEVKQKTKCGE